MALEFPLASQASRKVSSTIQATRATLKAASNIIPRLKKWAGFLFRTAVSFFNLSFSNLWDMFVNAYYAIKTFDWNATDEALEKQIEQNNKRLVTLAAETLGEYLGFQTVRLINSFIGRFTGNKAKSTVQSLKIPVLSAEIGLALAEESNEELREGVRRFLTSTISAQVSNAFIATVLTARRNHFMGFQSITTPQANGSIAQKIENAIQTLPQFWQQPVEELIEGFEEGIIEAGYIVAFKIDDHIAAMRYARQNAGPRRVVEVEVDKESEEKLEFTGSQEQVIEAMQPTLMGTVPLIKNRDVGTILAEPDNETIKPKIQLRKLVVNYNEYPKPPYRRRGKLGARASISVPDAKPGITYEQLKSVTDEYVRGNTFVSVELDNGRQMFGYFSTANVGEKVLTRLASLSTSDILPDTFRASKPATASVGPNTQVMYPSFVSLLYPKRKNGKNSGPSGKPVKVFVYADSKPQDFKPFV